MALCAVMLVSAPAGQGHAAPFGPGALAAGAPPATAAWLHRADTFPQCIEQRGCWRDASGRQRCGRATRCQECSYVRKCDRSGCAWREVCRWGPYKPALKTN